MLKLTTVQWHDAKTDRPPCDGTYLCNTLSTLIMCLDYNKQLDKFNVSEHGDPTTAIEPLYWAEVPDITNARDDSSLNRCMTGLTNLSTNTFGGCDKCGACPYFADEQFDSCVERVSSDALAYIEYLKARADELSRQLNKNDLKE